MKLQNPIKNSPEKVVVVSSLEVIVKNR